MSGKQFLLDVRAGWRAGVLSKTALADGLLQLQTMPGSGRPIVDAAGSFGGLQLPAGMGFDTQERLYILDRTAALVKRYDPCQEAFETLPCVGGKGALSTAPSAARQFNDPQGLAISPRDDLYVADTGNARVQVFALKGLVLRAVWLSPREAQLTNDWQPADIAIDCHCRAYVCDKANGLIHVFDALGRWCAAYDGASHDSPKLDKPTRIALDKDANLYILQDGKDYVTVLDKDGHYLRRVERPEDAKGVFCPIGIGVDEDGTLFIADRVARQIITYRTDACGRQTACAVRGVSATCQTVAFDRQGNPLIGDGAQGCVVQLVRAAAYQIEGSYTSTALDSDLYRCQWHRVRLHVDVPVGTQVRIDTFTSDALKSDEEISLLDDSRWATGILDTTVGDGAWDCLILSVPGRYLWLRLMLTGEGKTTPTVRSVRIDYPRETSLQYLPAVFAEEASSRDFTERFLSIFDALNGRIDHLIASMARLFDPGATPSSRTADFLGWLAGWMGLAVDQNWPEDKFRNLLRHAHRLYALRGTPAGLKLHIKLFLGVEPAILEHYTLPRWLYLNSARLGDTSTLYGQAVVKRLQLDEYSRIGDFQLIDSSDPLHDPFYLYAHRFTVFVPQPANLSDTAQRVIEQIIETDKPAHTLGTLRMVQPQFRVGAQAFIGMDTVVGRYPDQVKTGAARLGYDATLGPSEDEAQPPEMRIGKRSRIGTTTALN
jgi:phage tail-like protein